MNAHYKKITMEETSEEFYSCLGCNRSFPSKKSLYGHMGRNPECNKRYRGIIVKRPHPPNPNRNIASPASVFEHVESVQVTASLMGMVEWVEKLPAPIFRQRFRKEIEEFYKDWSTEDYYEGDGSEYEERYRRFLLAQMSQSAGSNTRMNDSKVMNDNSNMEIKIKKRKLSVSREENCYDHGVQYYSSCNMCEKTFASPQALGGHKTCHRKVTVGKFSLATTKTNEEAADAKRHVCKTCKKEYTSGPALGGHQTRLHYECAIGSYSVADEEEEMAAEVGREGQEPDLNGKDEEKHGLLEQGAVCQNTGSLYIDQTSMEPVYI